MSPSRAAGWLLACLLLAPRPGRAAPRLAEERVVLRTASGDVVLALYPEVAPRHVERVLELARLGVYDGSRFDDGVPGLYAQLSLSPERKESLDARQRGAIGRLRDERGPVKHRRGSLSMSRDSRFPNTATTSFSILLADWPGGDGKYTVFGEVESGLDVVAAALAAPLNGEGRPTAPLEVLKAEVVDAAALRLRPADPTRRGRLAADPAWERERSRWRAVGAGILLMVLCAAAAFFSRRSAPGLAAALDLAVVLAGGFLLLIIFTPMARFRPLWACALFLGLLGVLRLMGRFESRD